MSTRLLLVTEQAREVELLKSAFPRPEFLLRFESNAPKALQCADSWRPHLALLDLGCVVAPWRELLAALEKIPVPIFLSASVYSQTAYGSVDTS